jgi:2',3'-cyclic-nucleotide 2'-phosphodiesterase (5'-nucleotidase family)
VKTVRLKVLLILSALLPGPAACTAWNLTLLHTNDLHGQYLSWFSGREQIGGMEALFAAVAAERNGHTLLLDGGDHQTGTLLSHLSVDGTRGGGMVRLMDLLGVAASAVGNHEFDSGFENLGRLAELARFDMLAANLSLDGRLFPEKAYAVYVVGGVRVGVIGLADRGLAGSVFPPRLGRVRIADPHAAARRLVRLLDPETDVIVLLTHQGFREDSLLARAVPGADVIVGGHSHHAFRKPRRVAGTLVVQAGSRGEFLGRLDLTVRNDRVAEYEGRLIPVRPRPMPGGNPVTPLVREYERRIREAYGEILGELLEPWEPARDRESNVGNFFADVMRAESGADFAVINSGGIRKGLARGPIREGDIREVFPFENRLVRFSCTGGDIRRMVETNARSAFNRSQGILQVSGIRYAARRGRRRSVEVTSLTVNGRPVARDRTYTGVTVDYVVPHNARQYLGFSPRRPESLDRMLVEAVIAFVRDHPETSARVEGRMRHVR